MTQIGFDFFTPEKTTVSYPIAALNPSYEKLSKKSHSANYAPIPSDTKENQLCSLSPDELRKCINITLKYEDAAINFIENNSLKKPNRIDYINYLIGYFVFNGIKLSDVQKQYLISWYNNINFTNKTNSERREIYTKLINNN